MLHRDPGEPHPARAASPRVVQEVRGCGADPGQYRLSLFLSARLCVSVIHIHRLEQVAPCTSRGKKFKDVAGTPFVDVFFKTVLQTLVKSEEVGYDVAFYVGYDAGDEIWDTDSARRDLPRLLQSQVDTYYKKSLMDGVRAMDLNANRHTPGVSIKTVKCQSKSMVEASNCVIGQVYQDGAEYWYRVNDDTQFVTSNWIKDFNAQLAAFDPPNLGAVGPTCRQGNTGIMTYDYVHRTHWEVFQYQYPKVLQNWWCDDWITNVYGSKRTKKLKTQEVKHLISGTRYQVYSKDSSGRSVPKQLLPEAYKSGTCLIDSFLDKNPEFATKARTVNPSGRCTSSAGGQQRTPVECKTSPTGARVGGKEGWYWDKIQDDHPAKAEWVACPIPGVQESVWSGGCVDGRMNPDPVSSCGDLCASTEGCNFFWIFDVGRCCLKTTWDENAGNRPRQKVRQGGWCRMVH